MIDRFIFMGFLFLFLYFLFSIFLRVLKKAHTCCPIGKSAYTRLQSVEYILAVSPYLFITCSLLSPHFYSLQMASNANARGHHMPLSQTTRLEAFRSILKGVRSDSTRQRDDFRSSEPIHDDDAREVRDHWESPDKEGNQWRHGKVAGGSDRGSDRIEVNSLDVSSLLEEYV
jgi:hypothetical protein